MDWKPTLCLYHKDCADGFGAAWAIWRRWPDCEFIGVEHDKPLPDVSGHDVLFVDFAPKIDWVWTESFKSKSMVIVDHHKSAQADMERLIQFDGTQIGLDCAFKTSWTQNTPELACWFDMNHSGAVLAWGFAFPDSLVPALLLNIEDRDIWKWEIEGSKHYCLGLDSFPKNFEIWTEIASDEYDLMARGSAIAAITELHIEKVLANSYLGTLGGFDDVAMVNCPHFYASDVGNRLLKKYPETPFAAAWSYGPDGKSWSLRSENGREDVSLIAKKYGGGGHRNASGFREDE